MSEVETEFLFETDIELEPPQMIGQTPQGNRMIFYFRTAPLFQTASEKHVWLNRIQTVGVGWFGRNRVGYRVYAVL